MTAETLLMKLLAIPQADVGAFRACLEKVKLETLELVLIQLSQDPDDPNYEPDLEDWAAEHFPQTLGKYQAQN